MTNSLNFDIKPLSLIFLCAGISYNFGYYLDVCPLTLLSIQDMAQNLIIGLPGLLLFSVYMYESIQNSEDKESAFFKFTNKFSPKFREISRTFLSLILIIITSLVYTSVELFPSKILFLSVIIAVSFLCHIYLTFSAGYFETRLSRIVLFTISIPFLVGIIIENSLKYKEVDIQCTDNTKISGKLFQEIERGVLVKQENKGMLFLPHKKIDTIELKSFISETLKRNRK